VGMFTPMVANITKNEVTLSALEYFKTIFFKYSNEQKM